MRRLGQRGSDIAPVSTLAYALTLLVFSPEELDGFWSSPSGLWHAHAPLGEQRPDLEVPSSLRNSLVIGLSARAGGRTNRSAS